MAKDNDDTKPEVEETDDEAADREAAEILARAGGKKSVEKDEDDTDDAAADAEAEAGASDTVSRAELVKAIKRRQAANKKARELQAELDEVRRTNETDSEKAVREAEEKITKLLTGKYKPALIKTAAEAALLAAKPKKGKAGIPRLIKLMDLAEIEVNDDLELEGVEDEVTRLQEEFPELFDDGTSSDEEPEKDEKKTTTPRRRVTSRSQDGAGKKTPPVKKSTSEIIMAKLRGDDL